MSFNQGRGIRCQPISVAPMPNLVPPAPFGNVVARQASRAMSNGFFMAKRAQDMASHQAQVHPQGGLSKTPGNLLPPALLYPRTPHGAEPAVGRFGLVHAPQLCARQQPREAPTDNLRTPIPPRPNVPERPSRREHEEAHAADTPAYPGLYHNDDAEGRTDARTRQQQQIHIDGGRRNLLDADTIPILPLHPVDAPDAVGKLYDELKQAVLSSVECVLPCVDAMCREFGTRLEAIRTPTQAYENCVDDNQAPLSPVTNRHAAMPIEKSVELMEDHRDRITDILHALAEKARK